MKELKEYTCSQCGQKYKRYWNKVMLCAECQKRLRRPITTPPEVINNARDNQIYTLLLSGLSQAAIARKFGISRQRLGQIVVEQEKKMLIKEGEVQAMAMKWIEFGKDELQFYWAWKRIMRAISLSIRAPAEVK